MPPKLLTIHNYLYNTIALIHFISFETISTIKKKSFNRLKFFLILL